MRIYIKRIGEAGETFRGEESGAIMELQEEDVQFLDPVQYDLLAQVQQNALLVTGRLRAPVHLRCSRCLKIFVQELVVERFVYHMELSGQDFVDLTPQIREDIILELPQRALCDGSCKGLCPYCGTDLNVATCSCRPATGSPHWQVLDNLKLK